MRNFYRLVVLFAQSFDKARCHHEIFLGKESEGCACLTGTGSPTHAMYVIFQLLWCVIVDYILDIIDMKTTRKYISRNQHLAHSTDLEFGQYILSNFLLFISVNTFYTLKTLLIEVSDQEVHSFFRLTED